MPRIKSYIPKVSSKAGRFKPEVSPGVLGAAPSTDFVSPEQLNRIGGQLVDTSVSLLEQGLRQNEVFENLRKKGEVNTAMHATNTEVGEYFAKLPTEGEAATKMLEGTKEFLKKRREDALAAFEDDVQKELYNSSFNRLEEAVLAKTLDRQQKAILGQLDKSRLALNASTLNLAVIGKPDNPLDQKQYGELNTHWKTIEDNLNAMHGKNPYVLGIEKRKSEELFNETVFNSYMQEDVKKAQMYLVANREGFNAEKFEAMNKQVGELVTNKIRHETADAAVNSSKSLVAAYAFIDNHIKDPEQRVVAKKLTASKFARREEAIKFDEQVLESDLIRKLTKDDNAKLPEGVSIKVYNAITDHRNKKKKELETGKSDNKSDYYWSLIRMGDGIRNEKIDRNKLSSKNYEELVGLKSEYLTGAKVDKFKTDAGKIAESRIAPLFDPEDKKGALKREQFFEQFNMVIESFPADKRSSPEARAMVNSFIDGILKPVTLPKTSLFENNDIDYGFQSSYHEGTKNTQEEIYLSKENRPKVLKNETNLQWVQDRKYPAGAYVVVSPDGSFTKFYNRAGLLINKEVE